MLLIAQKLQERRIEPTLCVSDFKAQIKAKTMGFANTISIDVLRNMANVMSKGNVLIYESNEDAGLIQQDLQKYCSLVIKIDQSNFPIVDDCLSSSHNNAKCVFFGDDDYSELFLNMVKKSDTKYDISLMLGEYFFLNNDDILKTYFNDTYGSDEYKYALQDCEYLLSGNVQSTLQCRAMGKNVMFFVRDDKDINQTTKDMLIKYGILLAKTTNTNENEYFKNLISEFAKFTNTPNIQEATNKAQIELIQKDAKTNIDNIISQILSHIEQNN